MKGDERREGCSEGAETGEDMCGEGARGEAFNTASSWVMLEEVRILDNNWESEEGILRTRAGRV